MNFELILSVLTFFAVNLFVDSLRLCLMNHLVKVNEWNAAIESSISQSISANFKRSPHKCLETAPLPFFEIVPRIYFA